MFKSGSEGEGDETGQGNHGTAPRARTVKPSREGRSGAPTCGLAHQLAGQREERAQPDASASTRSCLSWTLVAEEPVISDGPTCVSAASAAHSAPLLGTAEARPEHLVELGTASPLIHSYGFVAIIRVDRPNRRSPGISSIRVTHRR